MVEEPGKLRNEEVVACQTKSGRTLTTTLDTKLKRAVKLSLGGKNWI
jgi:hypothetical protein